jgi:agmatine deiminase
MIADHQTNTVYLSDSTRLSFPDEVKALRNIIEKHGYSCLELNKTKDYYCCDFMPVQVFKDDFVQFVFSPEAYLKGKDLNHITNPVQVRILTPRLIKPRYSQIILDGGNVSKWHDKVIITDRVLKDNLYQFSSENAIIEKLEHTLECKVIIIPEYPGEETGHADGLVRIIDENTVFINDPHDEPEKEWLSQFLRILSDSQLEPINLRCPMIANQKNAIGLYLNYLHVGNLIIVPQFGLKEDKKAIEVFEDVFKNRYTIEPFEAKWIAKYGGVLNCATWTVEEYI